MNSNYHCTHLSKQPEEQAAAFWGAWMEVIVERFKKDGSPREWLGAWTQSKDSVERRCDAFAAVVKRAKSFWATDDDVLAELRAKRKNELSFKTQWYLALFKAYCSGPAEKLIKLIKAQSEKEHVDIKDVMIFSIDECSVLNAIASSHGQKSKGHVSSLISLQRIIKAQDPHINGFSFWFTFLDTNSNVSDFYPENALVASSARQTDLKVLPPWSFFEFDLYWPPIEEFVTKTPMEVVGLDFVKRGGRPVSSSLLTCAPLSYTIRSSGWVMPRRM